MKPWTTSAKAVLEVDLAAIQANFRTMRALVAPTAAIAGVVKSDAYGLGLIPVAEALHAAACDFFFVANLDEASRLRAALPDVAIAVLEDDLIDLGDVYRSERLIPVANTVRDIRAIGVDCGGTRYLLNADTGFSRFGLTFADVRDLYLQGAFRSARPHGIISHLACSDVLANAFNRIQRNRFGAICGLLRPSLRTLAASAGVWLGPSYHFDMVRLGSALYGLNNAAIQPNPLRQVVRLSARIVEVRSVPAGAVVGYGATFRTERKSRLGILGIGYTQGLPWSCANRIGVRIGTFTAPVIGRVAMEYVTIDLTDIPEQLAGIGTWVDILHEDFGPDDLASVIRVNAQEITIRLGVACQRRHRDIDEPLLSKTSRITEAPGVIGRKPALVA